MGWTRIVLIEQVEALGQHLAPIILQEEVQLIMELHLGLERTGLVLLPEQQRLEPLPIETLEAALVAEEAIAQGEAAVHLEAVALIEVLVAAPEAAETLEAQAVVREAVVVQEVLVEALGPRLPAEVLVAEDGNNKI